MVSRAPLSAIPTVPYHASATATRTRAVCSEGLGYSDPHPVRAPCRHRPVLRLSSRPQHVAALHGDLDVVQVIGTCDCRVIAG
eukprot:4863150-Prymnesium_polylepis.1